MRLSNLIRLFLALLMYGCDTANSVDPVYKDYFIKYYGKPGAQSGVDLVVNGDGSMVLLGNSVAPNDEYTAFVIKVDPIGNILWETEIGGVNETAVDVELVRNGRYEGDLVVVTNIGEETNSRIRIAIVGQGDGNILADAEVPQHAGGTKQVVKGVTSLANQEGFVITGYADKSLVEETDPIDENSDRQDLLAISVDDELTTFTSTLTSGGETTGSLIKTCELPADADVPLVVFGYSDKPVDGGFDVNYTYYLPESAIVGGSGYAGTSERSEELAHVCQSSDGNFFLMSGTSKVPGAAMGEIYLVKYGSSFEVRSLNRLLDLGNNLVCVGADYTKSTDYLVLANEVQSNDVRDILLAKVNYRGDVLWKRSFGTEGGDDHSGAVASLPDGRIAVVGTMDLATNKKLALIILNKSGGL